MSILWFFASFNHLHESRSCGIFDAANPVVGKDTGHLPLRVVFNQVGVIGHLPLKAALLFFLLGADAAVGGDAQAGVRLIENQGIGFDLVDFLLGNRMLIHGKTSSDHLVIQQPQRNLGRWRDNYLRHNIKKQLDRKFGTQYRRIRKSMCNKFCLGIVLLVGNRVV